MVDQGFQTHRLAMQAALGAEITEVMQQASCADSVAETPRQACAKQPGRLLPAAQPTFEAVVLGQLLLEQRGVALRGRHDVRQDVVSVLLRLQTDMQLEGALKQIMWCRPCHSDMQTWPVGQAQPEVL